MAHYSTRGVHGQTVDTIAKRILGEFWAEGNSPDIAVAVHDFRRSVVGAAHNEFLDSMDVMFQAGLAGLDRIAQRGTHLHDPVPGHHAVLDAIAQSDPTGAADAMGRVLDQTAGSLDDARAPPDR